jgi:alkaline phosphatase D
MARESVIATNPQLWLWTGDAIYAGRKHETRNNRAGKPVRFNKRSSTSNLQAGFRDQLQVPGYRALVSRGIAVEGVYDDHDYGMNDAGRELETKAESQAEFLKFLRASSNTVGQNDNSADSGSSDRNVRDNRLGAYSSHVYGVPPNQVKVVLMDTRYHR